MGDLLNNAVTGLLTYQRALSTTSHNIANVNTAGYSRQSVDIQTRTPTLLGGSFVGSGSAVDTIVREYNQFNTAAVRDSNSAFYQFDRYLDLIANIDNILADPEGGVSPIMQDFFSSVQDVADDPASSTARNQMIDTANSLVNRFQTLDNRLEELTLNTAKDLNILVDEVNSLVDQIREVNITLEEYNAGGELSQQSADLLDKRDALIDELSTKINIQVINPNSNNLTILVGNGQTMLTGATAFSLSAQPSVGDPTQDIIVYNGFTTTSDISGQLTGGELGGLLDFRNNVLIPSRNSLGRVAIGMADTFNDQHRQGMDLFDNLGGDFFTFSQPQTIPYSINTGAAAVTTTITDISQLTSDDYTLSFDGANWNVLSSSGSTATLTFPTDTFEGLTFNIGAGADPGDRYTIKPTFFGASTIGVAIDDPNLVAAAAPIRSSASLSNNGDLEITSGTMIDVNAFSADLPTPGDLSSLVPITFTFVSSTQFTASEDVSLDGGATVIAAGTNITFANGMTIEAVDGAGTPVWSVNLSGNSAQTGDQFTVEANLGGQGDNRNALGLGELQTMGVFDGSTANYQEAYATLVGDIGSQAQTAEVDRSAQEALLIQAQDRKSQLVGVNLDEEAADLIKYQQAYEASAQIIATAQTIFETLISSLR